MKGWEGGGRGDVAVVSYTTVGDGERRKRGGVGVGMGVDCKRRLDRQKKKGEGKGRHHASRVFHRRW